MSSGCQSAGQIQQGLGVSGFALDGLTKELDRFIRAAAPRAHDAQLRQCRDVAGIERQDTLIAGSRRGRVFPQQGEIAQTPERFDVVRNELEDPFAQRGGLVVLVPLDAYLGERNQGLCKHRVLVCRTFQNQGRFLEAAGEAKIVAEHDGIFRRELSFLVERTEVRNGEIVAARGGVRHRPRAAGHEYARIELQEVQDVKSKKKGKKS